MWGTLLFINGILGSLATIYLVYSVGPLLLNSSGKPFLVAVGIFLFLMLTEIIFAIKAE